MMSHVNEIPRPDAVLENVRSTATNFAHWRNAIGIHGIRNFDYMGEHRLNYIRSHGLAISASAQDPAGEIQSSSHARMRNSYGLVLSSWNAAWRATTLVILMMLSLVFTSILYASLPGNGWTIYGANHQIEKSLQNLPSLAQQNPYIPNHLALLFLEMNHDHDA